MGTLNWIPPPRGNLIRTAVKETQKAKLPPQKDVVLSCYCKSILPKMDAEVTPDNDLKGEVVPYHASTLFTQSLGTQAL